MIKIIDILRKNNNRENKGITLIALIVTIIVLIILAGISINLLLGENGIIQRAKDAAIQQEKAQLIEEMKLAIINKQIQNKGDLTQSEIEEVLGGYGVVENENITTTKGGHVIPITDVYNGTVMPEPITAEWEIATGGDKDSSNSLTLGDLVQPTIASLVNEKFYVIGIGTETDPVVTLLAERCVKASSGTGQYTQMDFGYAGKLAFDYNSKVYYDTTTNPVTQAYIKTHVDAYVDKFIKKGMHLQEVTNEAGTSTFSGVYGRLMWGTNNSGEVNNILTSGLTNKSVIVYGPSNAKISYWLGSSYQSYTMFAWCVDDEYSYVGTRSESSENYCRSSSSYTSLKI